MEEIFDDYNDREEDSNFNLKAELYKYLEHWKWLLLGCILGGAIAFLYNRYSIPRYQSEATMMVLNEEKSSVSGIMNGSSSSASFLKLEDNSLENQIVTLKSKRLVKKVVDELNHNISYYVEGNVITTEAYKNSPVTIEFSSPDSIVDTSSLRLIVIPVSNDEYTLEEESNQYKSTHSFGESIQLNNLSFSINLEEFKNDINPVHIHLNSVEEVAQSYISQLQVSPKGKAQDILSLSTVNNVSRKGEDFLNNLIFQFNEDGVADKRQVALKTTQFIQKRLEIITSELDSVETGLAEMKRENQIMDVATGAQEFTSKRTTAEQEIFNIETQIEVIESVRDEIQQQENFELLPANLGIQSGSISSNINLYNQLITERNALLQSGTEENPVIQDMDSQLSNLRQNLIENIGSTIRSLNIQKESLNELEASASNQFSTFPGMEKGLRGIVRQQQIKEQLYLFLLQRREEAAIAFAATSPVAKVIDSAFTYPSPVSPQPWLILVAGFLIGLIIPIIIIFVKNLLDTKVHHKGDLQPLIKNVPFVGEIPKIDDENTDIIMLNDRSPLAESFRILRTNLAYLIQNKDREIGNVIFVTSTIKGEGKTFVSYNLSRTLSSTNKKVLLIGADIRNPKLHRYTSMTKGAKEKGLSDYLYDFDVSFSDITSKTNDEGIEVDVILSGPIPPNPAELLMNDRMEKLIQKGRELYDYVIVDTAPTMIVTDTLLISPLADYTIYVTRADYTEKNLLEFPKDLKKQGKLKGIAVVLNDVDYSKFSYGAKYGYSYGYGYGYGVDQETRWEKIKKSLFG